MSRSFILGLTGGIGSGKSTVSALLKEKGAYIIDADEISRHALDIGTGCYRETARSFGPEILNPDGSVNRKALAKIVFNSEQERQRLSGIIHPYVRKTIYAETEQAKHRSTALIVWDIPLLLEGGYDKETDAVLVVTCPLEERLKRLNKRSGLSREEALARVNTQMPDEERRKRAEYVLDNGGTLEQLKAAVEQLYEQLTERIHAQKEE